jgi:hypothetical protein
MKYLIAQGPGYYGVNIREISDRQAADLVKQEGWAPADQVEGADYVHIKVCGDGTCLIVAGQGKRSAGFDTGWWDEGEKALDEAL